MPNGSVKLSAASVLEPGSAIEHFDFQNVEGILVGAIHFLPLLRPRLAV